MAYEELATTGVAHSSRRVSRLKARGKKLW
jgi:hypothetical protein